MAIVPPEVARRIRLIATDLDGTLLTSDKIITPRAAAAITCATAAGLIVVAATGRQTGTLPAPVRDSGIDYLLASNGAHGYRISTGQTLFASMLNPEVLPPIAAYLAEHLPGIAFGATRDYGQAFACEPDYFGLMNPAEREHDRREFRSAPLAQVLGEPALKVVGRHPSATPEELLATLEAAPLTGYLATLSGAPFIEIGPPDITKATGLAQIATFFDIDQSEVLALGDSWNDVAMVDWAGWGVAVGEAVPELRAVANANAPSSDEDGFALTVEEILANCK